MRNSGKEQLDKPKRHSCMISKRRNVADMPKQSRMSTFGQIGW